jgi:hypothetical protein
VSLVRPFAAADLSQVATLYKHTLLNQEGTPSAALRDYFRSFYLDGPFRHADMPSLVHLDDRGAVSAFIGVHTVPYLIGDRPIRAAFCGALMSREEDRDPMAGARLLKAFLAGPQDVSMSETAIAVTQAMWAKLRGSTIPGYSLDWFRILRPAGFAHALANRKLPALAALSPLSRMADRLLGRRREASTLVALLPEPAPAGLTTTDAGLDEFAALMRRTSANVTARPDWDNGYLEHVLETARHKPAYGAPVVMVVRTRSGEALGGFFYHLGAGGIGRVLQIAAMPGHGGTVLDRLFADAHERGAAGLRGRSQPWLIEASTSRQMIFATNAASVIHTRDPAIGAPFMAGDCVLNGLAGESWNGLFGGGFT